MNWWDLRPGDVLLDGEAPRWIVVSRRQEHLRLKLLDMTCGQIFDYSMDIIKNHPVEREVLTDGRPKDGE